MMSRCTYLSNWKQQLESHMFLFQCQTLRWFECIRRTIMVRGGLKPKPAPCKYAVAERLLAWCLSYASCCTVLFCSCALAFLNVCIACCGFRAVVQQPGLASNMAGNWCCHGAVCFVERRCEKITNSCDIQHLRKIWDRKLLKNLATKSAYKGT